MTLHQICPISTAMLVIMYKPREHYEVACENILVSIEISYLIDKMAALTVNNDLNKHNYEQTNYS